jgi:Fe-S-cluster formation regulator IscX/YfhJ
MPWTCFIAAGSMDSVWFPRTAISPGWPPVSASKAWTFFGFGEHKTPASFRQACRRFIYTENLLAGAAGNLDPVSPARPHLPASAAAPVIEKVLTQMESEDGWVTLREVRTQLANLASDFDPRTYGFRKLSDLVRKTNAFDIEQLKGAPCAFA